MDSLYWFAGAMGLIGAAMIVGGFRYRKENEKIKGATTGKISQLRPGLVRLTGTVSAAEQRIALFSKRQYVHYRREIYQYQETNNKKSWQKIDQTYEESHPFMLSDDTGRVLVEPKGMEITATQRRAYLNHPASGKYLRDLFAKIGTVQRLEDTATWGLQEVDAEHIYRQGFNDRPGDEIIIESYLEPGQTVTVVGTLTPERRVLFGPEKLLRVVNNDEELQKIMEKGPRGLFIWGSILILCGIGIALFGG